MQRICTAVGVLGVLIVIPHVIQMAGSRITNKIIIHIISIWDCYKRHHYATICKCRGSHS